MPNCPNTTISIQSGGVLDASQATSGLTINAGETFSIGRTRSAAPICWAMRRSAECSISAAARDNCRDREHQHARPEQRNGGLRPDEHRHERQRHERHGQRANLSLTGTTTLNINPVNLALGNGNYNLFTFSGNLSRGRAISISWASTATHAAGIRARDQRHFQCRSATRGNRQRGQPALDGHHQQRMGPHHDAQLEQSQQRRFGRRLLQQRPGGFLRLGQHRQCRAIGQSFARSGRVYQ